MSKQLGNVQHRALKLRIYPTSQQEQLINKTFGCVRQVYNNRLFERNQFYETVIKPEPDKAKQKQLWKSAHFSSEKELKQKFPYLSEVSSQALCSARLFAEQAYQNFFSSLKGIRAGTKIGKPKFKSKKSHDFSYRECMNIGLLWKDRQVKVPKLGLVKFRHSGNKKGKLNFFLSEGATLKSITIRRNPANQYYAVLLFEREYIYKKKVYENDEIQVIGLDFSPNQFYIDSECHSGIDYGYIPQKQSNLKKLTKLQRRFARTKKGSHNHEKARIKVARLEHYISECRNDWIEKETKRLVSTYQIIGIEDLNIKGMMRFSKNAKNYNDVAWNKFVTKLIWKASLNEHNCQVIKADRFFPSSQICSCCGYQNPLVKDLKVKSWICPNCGVEHNRDYNAAINLKRFSINQVGLGESELMSVEGVEALANLALASDGASDEPENLTSDGQNVLMPLSA